MSQLSFTFKKAYGTKLLASSVLCFDFNYTYRRSQAKEKMTIIALEGTAFVSALGLSNNTELGVVKQRKGPVPLVEGHEDNSITFSVDLTPRMIEGLERHRVNGGLRFSFSMRAIVQRGKAAWGETLHTFEAPINQSDWCLIREQLGFHETLLLEVPLPKSPKSENLRVPLKELQQTMAYANASYTPEAIVAKCRKVLEALRKNVEEDHSGAGHSFLQRIMEEPDLTTAQVAAWPKEKRLCALRKAIITVLHAAAHVEEENFGPTWTRKDAQLLTGLSVLLMNWYVDDEGELIFPTE